MQWLGGTTPQEAEESSRGVVISGLRGALSVRTRRPVSSLEPAELPSCIMLPFSAVLRHTFTITRFPTVTFYSLFFFEWRLHFPALTWRGRMSPELLPPRALPLVFTLPDGPDSQLWVDMLLREDAD